MQVQKQHEFRPMVIYKLNNRSFELSVLRAIFEHESDCQSLIKLPGHPSSWGFASRGEIARRMGHKRMTKSLSRRIRKAFLWLEEVGYLKHKDINKPGMDPKRPYGATHFLIAYWVFRLVQAVQPISAKAEGSFKAFEACFRTPTSKILGGLKERAENLKLDNMVLTVT